MTTTIINYLFIYFLCAYIFNSSLHLFKNQFVSNSIIAILLTTIAYFLNDYPRGLSFIFPLLLFWIIASKINSLPQISLVAITISFVISFSIYSLFSFIITFFIIIVYGASTKYIFIAIPSGILQTFLTIKLFNTKRLKNGIPFLSSTTHLNTATILCLTFIGFTIYVSTQRLTVPDHIIGRYFLFAAFTALAFLIYWWQAQITKSYRRSLELRELESLKTEVAELLLQVQKLSEENERLARITHRDNTLISTLKNSAVNFLVTDYTNPADAIAAREKLIANIDALSAGRTNLPDNSNEKKARTFDTGVSLLDELLHQMDLTAIENQITFSVHMGTMLSDFVPAHISSDDLVHTVDDLLKNAFKATATCEKRIVQLQFYKWDKHFVIEVADNGIPFEVKSLVNMGIEKLTTYADGSGIGLVDIWNTKTKYGATYHIEEYAVAKPFSKKIYLTFNKKNLYSIRTWRKNEIMQMSKRADLQVYGDLE